MLVTLAAAARFGEKVVGMQCHTHVLGVYMYMYEDAPLLLLSAWYTALYFHQGPFGLSTYFVA